MRDGQQEVGRVLEPGMEESVNVIIEILCDIRLLTAGIRVILSLTRTFRDAVTSNDLEGSTTEPPTLYARKLWVIENM